MDKVRYQAAIGWSGGKLVRRAISRRSTSSSNNNKWPSLAFPRRLMHQPPSKRHLRSALHGGKIAYSAAFLAQHPELAEQEATADSATQAVVQHGQASNAALRDELEAEGLPPDALEPVRMRDVHTHEYRTMPKYEAEAQKQEVQKELQERRGPDPWEILDTLGHAVEYVPGLQGVGHAITTGGPLLHSAAEAVLGSGLDDAASTAATAAAAAAAAAVGGAVHTQGSQFRDGKIYLLSSATGRVCYVGSTFYPLEDKLRMHKNHYSAFKHGTMHYVSSYDVLKHPDAKIRLLAKCACKTKRALEIAEGKWQRKTYPGFRKVNRFRAAQHAAH